ncbi:MAG TPA: Omp28-related outer membrane protein [Bacteroidia bacterium]|nr:Omp28-related outer membrane protein [Bacteroidia bacterium]
MKKITITAVLAAGLLAGATHAQAPKFVLFEHFTQASCAPCAAQNPGFQNTILTPNPDKVRHIAVHTSWPGVDPMYNYNTALSAARVTYYNITGVPTVVMLGNQKTGQPGAFTQSDVDNAFSAGSPIKITVNDVDNGTTHDVTVNVLTVGTVPSGTYKLRAAIVEDPITYATPPGTNGETTFPDVLRQMLPSASGDPYTPAAIGNTVTFNYTYTEDAAWVMPNIKVIAFVQNETTKEILQCGTMNDPVINYTLSTPAVEIMHGTSANASSFSLNSMNTGSGSEDFVYTLTTDIPGDWTANFSVNSTTYSGNATITTAAAATNNIMINITPGTTPYVGRATLTVASASNPSLPVLTKNVYVISNVTDLIVNNTGGIGDGVTAGNASNWDSCYVNGMIFANEPGWAKTTSDICTKAIQDNAFQGIHNVYYNVGWTFPSLTDNFCTQMTSFLNAGGCLFISGQDIAWETWDTANSPYWTSTTENFFSTYFGATFSADGSTANSQLTAVTSDPVFGTVPNSTIGNFYGGNYFYPDEINAANGGTAVFKYNNGTKTAGTRNFNGTWKVVYISVGIEMLTDYNAKNEILKWSHDWFYGLLSTNDFDHNMNSLSIGQNYPNPSNLSTIIPLDNVKNDMTLQVVDLQGRVVMSQAVAAGATQAEINTADLAAGTYMYRLMNGQDVTETKRLQVVH